MILNQKLSKKFHIISFIISVISIIAGVVLYLIQYSKLNEQILINVIPMLTFCVVVIAFGIVLFLLNFEENWVKWGRV